MRRLYYERLEKKAFKMSLVLQLRDLEPEERSRKIDELSTQTFAIPFSRKKTLSRSVIYQWLKDYAESHDPGQVLVSQERSDRDSFRTLSQAQKNALALWRTQNPYRSAAELREELMAHPQTSQDPIPSESTLVRFLRSRQLERKRLLQRGTVKAKVRLSYESPYPQWLWLADTKGPNLWVVDPERPGKTRSAKPIVVMDDFARFVVAAHYVFEDNEALIMELLRGALARYGIPNSLYVDRGSPYMGNSLQRASTLLGCKIIHTQPRDASAKGKVERIMRSFYERLETELILRQPPPTLEEANEYLAAFTSQDYHRRVHSEIGQSPEERFFHFPPQYRRFVSQEVLTLVFLPCRRSKVSKTGLIHLNQQKYLVTDATLYQQWVEVRCDLLHPTQVYVWWRDRYYGEADLYVAENDYVLRQEHLEKLSQRVQESGSLPGAAYVPPYSRLERKLAEYRQEVAEGELNESLKQVLAKKEQIRAELTPVAVISSASSPGSPKTDAPEWGLDRCAHLISTLLKRPLDARERLALATVWQHYGPWQETWVRQSVGRLLGEGHPVSDLMGYLDDLRLAAGK